MLRPQIGEDTAVLEGELEIEIRVDPVCSSTDVCESNSPTSLAQGFAAVSGKSEPNSESEPHSESEPGEYDPNDGLHMVAVPGRINLLSIFVGLKALKNREWKRLPS